LSEQHPDILPLNYFIAIDMMRLPSMRASSRGLLRLWRRKREDTLAFSACFLWAYPNCEIWVYSVSRRQSERCAQRNTMWLVCIHVMHTYLPPALHSYKHNDQDGHDTCVIRGG